MPSDPTRPASHPARNLHVALIGTGIGYAAWSWADFSGPFRSLVDLQLRFFGGYSEPFAGVATVIALVAVAVQAVMLVRRVHPDLSASTADAAIATGAQRCQPHRELPVRPHGPSRR